jgi:hypothetical protein
LRETARDLEEPERGEERDEGCEEDPEVEVENDAIGLRTGLALMAGEFLRLLEGGGGG